jgi:hypothetical protein
VAAAMLLAFASAGAADLKRAEVPFPGAFRSWQHVKSVVMGPEHPSFAKEGGKIFEFYANPQAVMGYGTGKFPNGSVLVRETLRALPGSGETKGVLAEGERSAVDVMVKDDGQFKETGGWGFETFDSKNARLGDKERAQCYACHAMRKDHDFVFSSLRTDAEMGTPYPEGYRSWTFLHSLIVSAKYTPLQPCEKPCTAGIFHFYANERAMDGLRTGTYQDGAIIAEELLEWLTPEGSPAKEGRRRFVCVMVKDAQRYSSTGGWGYGVFDDGSRGDKLDAKARADCHTCHVAREKQGFVFAEYAPR